MAVYEYCPGNNLYKYLRSNPEKCRDVAYLKQLFVGLISALDHVHSRGYLHCDLKPENILVGANGEPKLADFGMSLRFDSPSRISNMCMPYPGLSQKLADTHHPQGTPSYLAPEVVTAWFTPKAPHKFSGKIDIFSLGVVAINVVSGKYPFKRVTARLRAKHPYSSLELATIFMVPKKRIEEMSSVSAILAKLVEKCLHQDPAQRPTAAELLAALTQSVATEPAAGKAKN